MFSLALLGWILAVGKLLPRGAGSCDAPGSETCGSAAVWGENKQKWVRPREMLPLSELQQEWVKSPDVCVLPVSLLHVARCWAGGCS